MLTSASVMALASFGLVLVAVRIFAMFAQWCSRACAGESCVVTLVFGMHAHSECEVMRLRASPAKRGVQPWLRCTRVTFVSMCRKQACGKESGRASIWRWMGKWHGLVRCLAALAEVQALSCCMLSHNRVSRLWPGFFEIRKKILGRGHKKEILKNIRPR